LFKIRKCFNNRKEPRRKSKTGEKEGREEKLSVKDAVSKALVCSF